MTPLRKGESHSIASVSPGTPSGFKDNGRVAFGNDELERIKKINRSVKMRSYEKGNAV